VVSGSPCARSWSAASLALLRLLGSSNCDTERERARARVGWWVGGWGWRQGRLCFKNAFDDRGSIVGCSTYISLCLNDPHTNQNRQEKLKLRILTVFS
jgi:hypothetical protein